MTGIADDHDAAEELVLEEYRRLRSHGEDHSLLEYLTDVGQEGFKFTNYDQFLGKFLPEGKKYTAIALANYYVALRRAVDEIEGINREPKKPVIKENPPRLSERDSDLEIPF
jgi:hypothetical protein|tara:strand:- start:31 stop:366 length:336 start_codon:yes stop_codon:yes gene_type:complete